MANWDFQVRGRCPLFRIIIAEPEKGQEQVFSVVGDLDPETGFIDTSCHVSCLVRGKTRTEYLGLPSYESVGVACINPLTGIKQRNPSVPGVSVPLSDDVLYLTLGIVNPDDKRKLGFEVFQGNDETIVFEMPKAGYAFLADGEAKGYELFEPQKLRKGAHALNVGPDSVVFFVWKQ